MPKIPPGPSRSLNCTSFLVIVCVRSIFQAGHDRRAKICLRARSRSSKISETLSDCTRFKDSAYVIFYQVDARFEQPQRTRFLKALGVGDGFAKYL